MAKLEEVLGETFATSQDGKSCFWALRDLEELRIYPREKWKEWDKLVRSRFREEHCQERTNPGNPVKNKWGTPKRKETI
jgi:hypothetical protein